MEWRLRRAGAEDAPALSLVASAAFLDAFAFDLSGPDLVAHCTRHYAADVFERQAGDTSVLLTLAEAPTGAPLGYTMLRSPDLPVEHRPDDLELVRLYTLAIALGSGLGAALMARAVEDARALGRTRLLLGVNARNARALGFYAKSGFIPIGKRRFLVGASWQDDLILAKPLR